MSKSLTGRYYSCRNLYIRQMSVSTDFSGVMVRATILES